MKLSERNFSFTIKSQPKIEKGKDYLQRTLACSWKWSKQNWSPWYH